MSDQTIVKNIVDQLSSPSPVLFAGAGVGCRVGLPGWDEYIELLAENCDKYGDIASAKLIRHRLKMRQYKSAASVYKTCESIPQGELLKGLAAPFTNKIEGTELDKLRPLVGLGHTAIITTNFDRSLHNAYAREHGRTIIPIERNRLAGASLHKDVFISRIHGCAEHPESMVVETRDFEDIKRENAYLDFLMHILAHRSCLFIGFSFQDPAIDHVLAIYKEKFGPTYGELHTALIPGEDGELYRRLTELNIETFQYSNKNNHRELWQSIREAYDIITRTPTGRYHSYQVVRSETEYSSLHLFMAFAYAQCRTAGADRPVLTIVEDGIVMSVIDSGVDTRDKIIAEVGRSLRASADELSLVVDEALGRLVGKDQVEIRDSRYTLKEQPENILELHLDELSKAVTDRMYVREGIEAKRDDRIKIRKILDKVFMSRAWDLAAHFAGAASGWSSDLRDVIKRLVSEEYINGPQYLVSPIERAVLSLLSSPDLKESDKLSTISRAAFGVQLVLSSPRQSAFQKFLLPQKVYLDANVLMPAITDGHPLSPVYSDTFKRLADAAKISGFSLKIIVGLQFLNEVVSHRKIAIDLVKENDLEDPEELSKHISYYSAINTNVFVGAYASFVGREKKQLLFDEFLSRFAPYHDEESFAVFLGSIGIDAIDMNWAQRDISSFTKLYNRLIASYEAFSSSIGTDKDAILIQHEALQLSQIQSDYDTGVRSIFVTADSKLRKALKSDNELSKYSGMTVSHLGLVTIIDVLVGLKTDARSLARLIWAIPSSTHEEAAFEYFINVGLKHYEEGMALEMQEAAREVAKEIADEAEKEGIKLFPESTEDVARTARYLDRFEDKFFQNWKEAIKKSKAV